MGVTTGYYEIRIRKRPWYIWLLRVIWLLWLAFWLEIAIGSKLETEAQAFQISLYVFIFSLIFGLGLSLSRHYKRKKASSVS